MFTTDFIFDGQRASDHGLVICSFDGDYQPVTGGEVEFEVVKPPDNDKFDFYGAQYTTPLEWNISIMKNSCKFSGEDIYFTNEDERIIYKWLQKRDGYHWFTFCNKYQDGEVHFNVKINIAPRYIGGRTVGFDLVITADSSFGYTDLKKKVGTLSKTSPFTIYIDTDTKNYLLPEVYITGSGSFYISNDNDPVRNKANKKAAEFGTDLTIDKNPVSGTIYMNSEYGIIDGINLSNFNCRFLRLVDGKNVFTTNSTSAIKMEIYYREVRRIVV